MSSEQKKTREFLIRLQLILLEAVIDMEKKSAEHPHTEENVEGKKNPEINNKMNK